MMTQAKSTITQVQRTLQDIQLGEEDFEDVQFIIDEENANRKFKINFYQDRWRGSSEWRLLLKEILNEIDRLEKMRLIK